MKEITVYIRVPVEQEPEPVFKGYYTNCGFIYYHPQPKQWRDAKYDLRPLWYEVGISLTEYMEEAVISYHEAYLLLKEADLLDTLPEPKEYVLEYLKEKGVFIQ